MLSQTTTYIDNKFWDEIEDIYGYDLKEELRDIKSDVSWILDWIADQFYPSDVFDTDALGKWAKTEFEAYEILYNSVNELRDECSWLDHKNEELVDEIKELQRLLDTANKGN
jgi:hypothetical protein